MTGLSAPTPFARADGLTDRLAAWLREEILQGRLAPGARLVESEIALRCGVSRVPLREAFRILFAEGLVDLSPNRGASVKLLTDTELRELFGVRVAIEAFAAGSAARRADTSCVVRLRAMVDQMRRAVMTGDMQCYSGLAAGFHECLVQAGDNHILTAMYGQIRTRLRRYQSAMSRVPQLPESSIAEHEGIVDAIGRADAVTAATLAAAHIENLVARFAPPSPMQGAEPPRQGSKGRNAG